MTSLDWRQIPPVVTPFGGRELSLAAQTMCGPTLSCLSHTLKTQYASSSVTLTDSGTSALGVVLSCLSGPVALPGFGCLDLITAAQYAAVPVFLYDVDPLTLGPNLDSLEAVLQRGANAVVVASLYGYVPPMESLVALCRQYGAALIEDIAQSAGAKLNGRYLGTFGDFTVLSFGRGKGIGGGGGGAVLGLENHVLSNLRGVSTLRSLCTFALQRIFLSPRLFAIPSHIPWLALGETVYHAPRVPRTINRVQAALANAGLSTLDEERSKREKTALAVRRAIEGSLRGIAIGPTIGQPGFLRLAYRSPVKLTVRLRSFGLRRSYGLVLQDHPELKTRLLNRSDLDGAQVLSRELLTIPTHIGMSQKTISDLQQELCA